MRSIHIITPEYLPQYGGVADYTRQVARALAAAGDDVHVWCPQGGTSDPGDRFAVHPVFGSFRRADLVHAATLLDQFEGPRRLLVQWVPHGYGFRAMNLQFCLWLWNRSRLGDLVELMVHEPYLAFWEGTWRQTGAATVHRLMTTILLRAAHRVWVAIPAWERMWKPYAIGRDVPFSWLPIPSGLSQPDLPAVEFVRQQLGAARHPLMGHLGTYGSPVASLLSNVLHALLHELDTPHVVLMGSGSEQFHSEFTAAFPQHSARITATGVLSNTTLAAYVVACDLLIQPYPDGVTSRRTSAMAGLHLGVPVVTTAGRLTEPFWETCEAIRLSRVGDSAGMVAHAAHLLTHPDERKQLAENGRRFYTQTFDLQRTVTGLRSA